MRRRAREPALGIGLGASAVLHALLLLTVAFPTPELSDRAVGAREFRQVDLPPIVEVPDAPGPIGRPPAPSAAAVEVEGPAAIAGEPERTVVAAPVPEPPRVAPTTVVGRPALVPHDVAPLLEGRERFRRRLMRAYPDRLRKRGVEGVVELRFFVDAGGEVSRVRVESSSGHAGLDRAARRMADDLDFLPALNRDRPVGVWVSQRICFLLVEVGEEAPTAADCRRRLAVADPAG